MFGRLVSSQPNQQVSNSRQRETAQPISETRFSCQPREVNMMSESNHNIHRGSFPAEQRIGFSNSGKNFKNRIAFFLIKRDPIAQNFLRLIGLMASCIELVPHARLFMRPVKLHLLHYWRPVTRDLQAQYL